MSDTYKNIFLENLGSHIPPRVTLYNALYDYIVRRNNWLEKGRYADYPWGRFFKGHDTEKTQKNKKFAEQLRFCLSTSCYKIHSLLYDILHSTQLAKGGLSTLLEAAAAYIGIPVIKHTIPPDKYLTQIFNNFFNEKLQNITREDYATNPLPGVFRSYRDLQDKPIAYEDLFDTIRVDDKIIQQHELHVTNIQRIMHSFFDKLNINEHLCFFLGYIPAQAYLEGIIKPIYESYIKLAGVPLISNKGLFVPQEGNEVQLRIDNVDITRLYVNYFKDAYFAIGHKSVQVELEAYFPIIILSSSTGNTGYSQLCYELNDRVEPPSLAYLESDSKVGEKFKQSREKIQIEKDAIRHNQSILDNPRAMVGRPALQINCTISITYIPERKGGTWGAEFILPAIQVKIKGIEISFYCQDDFRIWSSRNWISA